MNPGFDAHNVLTMRMSLTGPQFEKVAGVAQLVRANCRLVGALPQQADDLGVPAVFRDL
jgi:hypothetical protein